MGSKNEGRTNQCSEPEPADSRRNKWNISGGWLRSLTLLFDKAVKGSAILLSLAAVGLLAGCALTSPHGTTTVDPLALAHRFDRSEDGFDYQAFCKELRIKSRMFARAEDDPPIAADVFTLDTVGTNLWRMIEQVSVLTIDTTGACW